MSSSLGRFVAVPLCLSLLVAATTAQDPKARKLQRDADFLRKVAKDLGFISLAKDEVDRMKAEQKDSPDFKTVLQLDVEISLIGAKRHPDREERRTLYKQVLDQLDAFITKYKDDVVALNAQLTMLDACYEYGRFLSDDIEVALAEAPDKVKKLEEDAANLFRRGVDACDGVMRQLKSAGGDKKIEYYISWLRKGILLREHARAVKKDRAVLAAQARATFEQLIFEVGEETALGLRALFEMSQISEVLGNLEEAITAYQETVDACYKSLTDEGVELKGNAAEIVVEMMEEAYDRLASSLFSQGKGEEVMKVINQYRERMKELNAEPDPRWGHMLFLTEARALAETGDPQKVGKALDQAREYNRKHPNDIVGLRAKQLIKEILSGANVTVSGDDLLEVAKGELQAKRYEDAVRGVKRALGAMTPEQLKASGLEAWGIMSSAFAAQERWLEATLALKQGLESFPPPADSETDVGSTYAERLTVLAKRLMAHTNKDATFAALEKEAGDLMVKYGGVKSEAKLAWEAGRTKLDEKKFAEAAEAFGKVPLTDVRGELARARQARAHQQADQVQKSRDAILQYREWLKTKDAKIDPNHPMGGQRIANRQLAQAECDFLEAYMLYQQGMGAKAFGGKKDPTKLPEVLAKLSDYKQRYEKIAPGSVELALDTLARVHAELGELDKAEEKFRSLAQLNPKSRLLASLSSRILAGHGASVKAAETELAALTKSGTAKPADVQVAQQKLHTVRKAALAAGMDYIKAAETPAYQTLYATLVNAQELRENDVAVEVGQKIISLYAESKENKANVDKWIRLIVGSVLLEKQDFKGAYEMLSVAEKANPTNYSIKKKVCEALGGWQFKDERGRISRIPGLDKPVEAYKKYWDEYKTYALSAQRNVTQFSLPWYRFHWEAYDLALAASRKDSKFAEDAKKLYGIAQSTDNFDTLKAKLGPEGVLIYEFFQANPPPR